MAPDPAQARGRGTSLNPANRFERLHVAPTGDHLDDLAREHPDGLRVPTRYYADRSRSVINRVDSPDLDFSWSLNPYRGCEHGCVYCYARPGHEMLGFASGLDFESRILVKQDAARLLRQELARPGWRGEPIALAGVTDPYQPVEADLHITRSCLEVMADARQPVYVVTKNRLVTRDRDVLARLATHQAVRVAVSVTTLDPELARAMEPRTSIPSERLRAVRELSEAGVPVVVMVAPVIPGLNDHEIPAILEAAAGAGAQAATWVMLRLPREVKSLFLDWLRRHRPERAAHVESLVREARGGSLNDADFGRRMRGTGARAEQIASIFEVFRKRTGLAARPAPLTGSSFRRPHATGEQQLKLF